MILIYLFSDLFVIGVHGQAAYQATQAVLNLFLKITCPLGNPIKGVVICLRQVAGSKNPGQFTAEVFTNQKNFLLRLCCHSGKIINTGYTQNVRIATQHAD